MKSVVGVDLYRNLYREVDNGNWYCRSCYTRDRAKKHRAVKNAGKEEAKRMSEEGERQTLRIADRERDNEMEVWCVERP